jgi:hypothetical protein
MNLVHRLRKIILKNSKFLSAIDSRQDNVFNGILDKTDPTLVSLVDTYIPILDTYTGADGAYSLNRQLKSSYTGPLFKVRRSSDDTELDIGFNALSGQVDTAALLDFTGPFHAYVTVLYDQSGFNNYLDQPIANSQPLICSNGGLLLENGKLCMQHRLGTTPMVLAGAWTAVNFSTFLVSTRAATGTEGMHLASSGGSSFSTWHYSDNKIYTRSTTNYIVSNSTYTDAYQNLLTSVHNNTTQNQYVNSTLAASTLFAVGTTGDFERIDSAVGARFQELIIFLSDQTAARAAIDSNIIEYYSISEADSGNLQLETEEFLLLETGDNILL